MKSLSLFSGYIFLVLAIASGILSNGFLKTTAGFTKLNPTLFCILSIIFCIFCLSKAMSVIPVGFAYSTYSGLTVTGVLIFAMLKYNQIPNVYALVGIILIVIGVVMVNYLGRLN